MIGEKRRKMNWQKISHLSKDKIKAMQDKKLQRFIRYQIPYHPYYNRIFKANNIKLTDIKTTQDLVKIPFTAKENIAPTAAEPKKYLDFVLQPNEGLIKKHAAKSALIKIGIQKIFGQGEQVKKKFEYEYKPIHLHFTTGRTALPTPFLYSARDIELLKEAGKRMMDVFGVPSDEIAINAFPYAPHLAFWQAFFGLTAANITSLQTGGGKILGTGGIIKAIENMKANLLIFMPGYAYHLMRIAAGEKRNFSSVKKVVFGGERVPPGLKDKIRDLLGEMGARNPEILSTYAFTEGRIAWPECSEESTGYHLYPDMEFIEIVDKNGERVGEGEEGEIVYTALDWHGSVVLRYKTGDITKGIYYERCPNCGRTVPRINADIQRKSEYKEFRLSKVKGTLVNLNAFFPLFMGNKDVEEWQVEIRKKNNDPYEIDEIFLYLAIKKGVDFNKLKLNLERQIHDELELRPQIIKMDINELLQRLGMETELKEKRIIDKRPKI